MSYVTPRCPTCGRVHGTIAHEVADQLHFSSLIAANTNCEQKTKPVTHKRLSASEAMAVTKTRYKETLEYLT